MYKNIQMLRAFAAISVLFVHIDKLLKRIELPPFG
jgi:peptidoglycan/LPS O-acetylase OafA/YrhL